MTDLRRHLPSVDHLLRRQEVRALEGRHGRQALLRALRAVLEEARAAAGDGEDLAGLLEGLEARVATRLCREAEPSLRRVLNATGVVVHTNLGRSPLPEAAAQRVQVAATTYSNLEFDLAAGRRGDRETHAEGRLQRLVRSEAALAANNNAAAVLLAVNSLAEGREVVVSRGELVEIGGSFRIPDVIRKGGARLREVGTTNRTRLSDYQAAVGPETALLLKVHTSNYRIVGFTEAVPAGALAELAQGAGVPLLEDLGSGVLQPLPPPLAAEPCVSASLAAGVDVVTFSGDKLLGGPQAGLVVGRRALLDRLRRNPLYRALRLDKMTIAALDAVLGLHEAGRADEVPTLRMLALGAAELRERAAPLAAELKRAGFEAELEDGVSAVGGGAAPGIELPTCLVALRHAHLAAEKLAAAMRAADPPVVARIADDRVLLDLRTILPDETPLLLASLLSLLR